MATPKTITLQLELSGAEAWDYAQFLKRVGFREYLANSTTKSEANRMLDVGEKIREALRASGIAPR